MAIFFFSSWVVYQHRHVGSVRCTWEFFEGLVWIYYDSFKGLERLCHLLFSYFFFFFHFLFFPSRLDSAGFTALCLLQLNLNDMVFGKWKRAYLHIEWTDRITSGHWRTTLMPGNVRPLMMRSHGADFKTSRKPVKKNNNNQIGNSCMKVPSGSRQIFLSVPNHGGK